MLCNNAVNPLNEPTPLGSIRLDVDILADFFGIQIEKSPSEVEVLLKNGQILPGVCIHMLISGKFEGQNS